MPAPIVAAIAPPLIASLAQRGLELLSGFFNTAAEPAVDRVSKLIEDSTGITVQQIADEKLSDDQWVKLKDFELQNQELLIRELEARGALETSRIQLANEDTRNAREHHRFMQQSEDWLGRNFVHIFAIVLTGLTFYFILYVISAKDLYTELLDPNTRMPTGVLTGVSQTKAGTVDTVLGFLLGVTLSAVVQFFYGSSRGSQQKHDTIDRLVRQGGTTADAAGGR